jgi:hypothetical protein
MKDPAFRESERERHRRQVKISIGGESVHVGYVPTLEAADMLRGKIVAETPRIRARARVRLEEEWDQAREEERSHTQRATQP